MRTFTDSQMDEIFEPLRETAATAQLQERVTRLSYPASSRPRRLTWTLAVAATTIAVLMIALPIQNARATSLLARIAQAVDGAKTMHARSFSMQNGKWVETGGMWYSHDMWRRENDGTIEIYNKERKYTFTRHQGLALQAPRGLGEQPPGSEGVFKLASIYGAMNRRGFKFKLTYGTPYSRGNANLVDVIVSREGHETEREVFQVDSASDLPLTGESQILDHGNWRARMKWECEYDKAIPDSVFEPNFPAGTRIVDLNGFRTEWENRLAKPVASFSSDGEPVQIRNIQVVDNGGVFLLWTGKIGDNDHRLYLEDDLGQKYVRAYFNPGVIPSADSGLQLLTVNGELIDGAWFVPLRSDPVSRPRSYTFRVARCPMPKYDPNRGGVVGYWLRRPYEPEMSNYLDGETLKLRLTPAGSVDIPAPTPLKAAVPDYLPLFDEAPKSAPVAARLAVEARIRHWLAFLGPNYKIQDERTRGYFPPETADGRPAGPVIQIVVPSEHLPKNLNSEILRTLIELEQEMVSLGSDYNGGGGDAFAWFELSELERAVGMDDEAEQAIRNAERIRPEIRWRTHRPSRD